MDFKSKISSVLECFKMFKPFGSGGWSKYKKILLLCAIVGSVFVLTSCSAQVYDTELKGVNVVFTPFVFIWKWFWNIFTPGFWGFVSKSTELQGGIAWVAVPVVYVLGGLLYLLILFFALIIMVILGILSGIAFFIGGIFDGIFHFSDEIDIFE